MTSPIQSLPLFVIENQDHRDVLRCISEEISFPLSEKDKILIETLKYTVMDIEMCSGLAAPQIGFSKRMIAFQVSKAVLKFRRDVEALVPLTVLINPTYRPCEEDGRSLDWEGCFSIQSIMGKVYRYKTITYSGQTEDGIFLQGTAHGFLARLLQHEIDHLNGKLACDFYDSGSPQGPIEEMRKIRLKEVEDLQERETL